MRGVSKAVLWLTVFTLIAAVCATIVVTALRSPVRGAVSRYTAAFSDVSGLFTGDDVRISGVQVGKVEEVRLDGRIAKVDFTALDDHPVYQNTVAAVRYQNLLGQRYVELVQPAQPGARLAAGATIPLEQTIPSFDVAKLFNGFRPVFQTLDPAQFNQFGENLLRVIQGDETGIGAVLHDLDVISGVAVNRQAAVTLLIRNLSEISRDLGGKSAQLFHFIDTLGGVLGKFNSRAEAFRASIDVELPAFRSLVHILQYAERIFDGTTTPFYDFSTRTSPQLAWAIAGLSVVPTLLQGLRDSLVETDPATGQPYLPHTPDHADIQDRYPARDLTCSAGEVELPGVGQVSFENQNLVVCK
ncbi:MlaD family protein [Mycobacterium kyorinense]|uniref:Mammalian cell entry protein n=1 Tax=Mycobacterium kyorinense TaxID=487514 RepID=A0A1X1XGD6_9MYCO|nr:MCE family protein [Mycobacterium kyorinense]ORV97967.1 mammalian cell entry protein [Mycobacterium kyorinense]